MSGTSSYGLPPEESMPQDLRECLQDCRNVGDFIERLQGRPEVGGARSTLQPEPLPCLVADTPGGNFPWGLPLVSVRHARWS